MSNEINEKVDEIVEAIGTSPDKVIPILQAIQNRFNYLPEAAMQRVCETTEIIPSSIHGISTFYSQFRLKPVGKHIIKVCVGTACHVKGAMQVYDAFRRTLNLQPNEETDAKCLFTLEKVACLGCCTLAPVVQVDDITYGNVGTEKTSEILEDFLNAKKNPTPLEAPNVSKNRISQGEIRIGLGSCC